MKKIIIIGLVCALTFTGCNDSAKTEHSSDEINEVVATQNRFAGATLEEFYDELFVGFMKSDPQYNDYLGDLSEYGVTPQKNLLTINSYEHQENMKAFFEDALMHLESFDIESTDDAYIDYLNVKWFIEMELEELEYAKHQFFLAGINGELNSLYSLLNDTHSIESEQDAEDWIARITMSEVKIKDWIERYSANAEDGYIMDTASYYSVVSQIRSMTPKRIELMDFNITFQSKVNELGLSEEKTKALHDSAAYALETYFKPNMEALKKTLQEYQKLSESPGGAWSYSNGDAYYLHALKKQTTTSMSPEEIHELGLVEVARIQAEMKQAFDEMGYQGSLFEMFETLDQNSTTYSGQAAMDRYGQVASEMEGQLSSMFKTEDLPATSPVIIESPGGNFYRRPSIDGKRKGAYYIALSYSHSEYGINALAYHETVPGHHFQAEHELLLENIPMIRKIAYYPAYREGWALYAEMLAGENGFYDTPDKKIGYLQSELFRAARLVVDTGIHYKKWSQEEGMDYLVNEAFLHPSSAKYEVTRYTYWPGQACAYKIGQLKLLELRNAMEDSLGDTFDIKEFHHLVLENGSMPLDILEEYVYEYMEQNN